MTALTLEVARVKEWAKAYPPLMKATAKVDLALGELIKKADGGNAYRILARLDG